MSARTEAYLSSICASILSDCYIFFQIAIDVLKSPHHVPGSILVPTPEPTPSDMDSVHTVHVHFAENVAYACGKRRI